MSKETPELIDSGYSANSTWIQPIIMIILAIPQHQSRIRIEKEEKSIKQNMRLLLLLLLTFEDIYSSS